MIFAQTKVDPKSGGHLLDEHSIFFFIKKKDKLLIVIG